jgi:hypothetical protein
MTIIRDPWRLARAALAAAILVLLMGEPERLGGVPNAGCSMAWQEGR